MIEPTETETRETLDRFVEVQNDVPQMRALNARPCQRSNRTDARRPGASSTCAGGRWRTQSRSVRLLGDRVSASTKRSSVSRVSSPSARS